LFVQQYTNQHHHLNNVDLEEWNGEATSLQSKGLGEWLTSSTTTNRYLQSDLNLNLSREKDKTIKQRNA